MDTPRTPGRSPCAPPQSDETTATATTRGHEAAVAAATETILNCYFLEGGGWRPIPAEQVPQLAEEGDAFVAIVPFPDERSMLLAGVRYLSPTHRHRFRVPVKIAMAGGAPWPVNLDTMMAMLADELGETHMGEDPTAAGTRGPDPTFLLARIRESVRTTTAFLDARDDDVDDLWSADPKRFIDSEQALLVGHTSHPTHKSRWEMDDDDVTAYAPETAARFALRWLAVDPQLVIDDSATGTPAPQLVEQLLRADPTVDGSVLDGLGERVLLPVHPWEFEHLQAEGALTALIDEGLVDDLGELGGEVTPTSSVHTVYRPDWPWQLTFSLHVQMRDEMHLSTATTLDRGVASARAQDSELGAQAAEIAPDVIVLRDPAYIAVRHGGAVVPGLSVVLRENRWRADAATDVSALEVLLQDHPYGGRSRLAQIVSRLAQGGGRSEDDVAREWFRRYCEVAVVPLLRLQVELKLHLQSDRLGTLLELDGGWPARIVLRGGSGYIAIEDGDDAVHGIGEAFLDGALGVVNALGSSGAVDEIVLLGDLKELLQRERERKPGAALLDRILDDASWPVKAHMHNRLHDEGAHVTRIPNPLHGVRP